MRLKNSNQDNSQDLSKPSYNPSGRSFSGWLGGKSQLARTIIEMMPEHAHYCEVFGGAGWVLFKKSPSKFETINDINGDLINLYRVFKYHLDALLQEFETQLIIGTVIAVDASVGKMRLKIDENETDWIPIPTMAAGVVKFWRCPSLGEQFSVTAQGGELTSAVPQVSLFSEANPQPTDNPDEVFIQLGEHSIVVNVATGEANFKLTKCIFDVPETIFKGKVHAEQDITSDTDVKAADVSLVQHPHGNVMNGPSQTSAAIPTGGV